MIWNKWNHNLLVNTSPDMIVNSNNTFNMENITTKKYDALEASWRNQLKTLIDPIIIFEHKLLLVSRCLKHHPPFKPICPLVASYNSVQQQL